jgi:hypothetical protein
VGEILIHYSAQMLDRICVFAVHHGKISGWIGRGLPLDAAELRSFSVAASERSLFREHEESDSYLGPVPPGPVNDRLMKILGPPTPSEVLVVPLAMNGRIKGYLMGDIPGRSVPASVRETLVPAGRAAGNALAGILRGRHRHRRASHRSRGVPPPRRSTRYATPQVRVRRRARPA